MKILNSLKAGVTQTGLLFVCVFISNYCNAQARLPADAVQVMGGYSRHGSGDFDGIVFGTEYIKYFSRKVSLNYNIRATINDGKEKIIVHNIITGSQSDASIRFTTAGVQLGVNGGLSFIRNSKLELMVSLGAFGRFQSASNGTDGYSLYFPAATGQPTVLIGYENRTPMRTLAIGGILQFHFNYTFQNKNYIGLNPAIQTDSNGDVIPQAAILIGRRF